MENISLCSLIACIPEVLMPKSQLLGNFFFHFQILDYVRPLRPYEYSNSRQQFLEYDGKVLRFLCMWDDSVSFSGEYRRLILHYFLSDGTIEVKEFLPHNSGRDPSSFFLRRGKLPKVSGGHRTTF